MFRLPTPEDIKRLRKKVGLTQTELAEKAGVSQSLIARIESGSVDPRLSTLQRILNAMRAANEESLTAKDIMFSPVITIDSDAQVLEAAELMRNKDISQLPVVKQGRPVGSINDQIIVQHLSRGQQIFQKKVEEIMDESFPSVSPSTKVEVVNQLLASGNPAVLVIDKGEIVGIITKIDLIAGAR
ncbi:MAG: CBS domain-containing protein [Candidatus Freyrarchaeum guaymaensis]|nr:CBS domain-containing protein [Candidatus Sigynarchaeota archaeon]